jgi:hypothetical protein
MGRPRVHRALKEKQILRFAKDDKGLDEGRRMTKGWRRDGG